MKKRIFTGCATALVTPFNDDCSVNYPRLRQLIEEQIVGGVDALVICGTTGESATLDNDEHCKVLEEAVKVANKRIPIIAGTGSNDTMYAAQLSQHAEAIGCDGLLMVTPYYNKTSQNGLINHYFYVADRVKTPIILYNVPSRTGTAIQPATYKELAKHENIVAVKEANGDISSIAKTRSLCGDELDIYSGNDDEIVPIMSLGGIGVISVLSNILPKETHDICAEYFKGNHQKACELQLKYVSLINALFSDVNPIPVKEAMNMMGLGMGPLRMPLAPMTDAARESLRAELKKHGLL
ncbi:MAG: 4-hydroxy-tetrahydrodipicolinate synthase [Clostridia bacterium]|nr:4-hydroxy-tetrahydrodipicolinate synthase [Clostridia bacterium]